MSGLGLGHPKHSLNEERMLVLIHVDLSRLNPGPGTQSVSPQAHGLKTNEFKLQLLFPFFLRVKWQ